MLVLKVFPGYVGRKVNVKQSLYIPLGLQEVEPPSFQDNQQMKVVNLSALCTSPLYHLRNIHSTHFSYSWVDTRAIVGPGGLRQGRTPLTPFRNRTHNLPAFSAVLQPTAPPCASSSASPTARHNAMVRWYITTSTGSKTYLQELEKLWLR